MKSESAVEILSSLHQFFSRKYPSSLYKISSPAAILRKSPTPLSAPASERETTFFVPKMGLLDKLWDDTVAGPQPESGLSKLRKLASVPTPSSARLVEENIPVTRSITIVKTASFRYGSADSTSAPSSPAGSSGPASPFSPTTPRGEFRKFRRRSTSEVVERAEPRSPTVCD